MRSTSIPVAAALSLLPALGLAQAQPQQPAQGAPAAQGEGASRTAAEAPPAGGSNTPAPAANEPAPAAAATPAPATPAPAPAAATAPRPVPQAEGSENRALPIVDLHGYLRARGELFNNFTLGWDIAPTATAGARPMQATDMTYANSGIPWFRNPDNFAQYCSQAVNGMIMAMAGSCSNNTQLTGNMRLRLNPEIHPTDFITIHSQIDILDNLVLGSTPEGYYARNTPTPVGAMTPSSLSPSVWVPQGAFASTQIAPIAGYNSITDSIAVRRAWAEVTNQSLGQLRVGRMASHWGLGLVANAGNGFDSDYQTTVDRIMYAGRLRSLGLFFAAMFDWVSSGATSQSRYTDPGQGQPYDLAMFDNAYQVTAAIGRRMDPDQQRAALARNEIVVNAGVYFVARWQGMSGENGNPYLTSPITPTLCTDYGSASRDCGTNFFPANAQVFIPDAWVQILGRNFRIEAELAYLRGGIYQSSSSSIGQNDNYTISQFGGALEAEYRLLNNRLKLEFRAGYASGDPDVEGLNYFNGLRPQYRNDRYLTLFRFHPDYRIDLIFWRQIMRQVSGAYYFRPSAQYNFIQDPNGDLLFARADIIWSRASEFVQTRGNHADLGVEIDATLQYQSNHRRDPNDTRLAPGFYAMAQYGVFFPLPGLGPRDDERRAGQLYAPSNWNLQIAQTARVILGVAF